MTIDTPAPAEALSPAPIQPHTLGHRLLWLVSTPEVGPAQLATYIIACLPDVHPARVEGGLSELVERGLLNLDDLTYRLTDAGRTEIDRLGVFTYA